MKLLKAFLFSSIFWVLVFNFGTLYTKFLLSVNKLQTDTLTIETHNGWEILMLEKASWNYLFTDANVIYNDHKKMYDFSINFLKAFPFMETEAVTLYYHEDFENTLIERCKKIVDIIINDITYQQCDVTDLFMIISMENLYYIVISNDPELTFINFLSSVEITRK